MSPRTPSESKTTLTDLVLPSETNPLGNMFGGELLARMDRAAIIAAIRHSRRIVVTVSVNHVAFNKVIPLGSVVTVEATISRAFKTSMEVFIDVLLEDRQSGKRTKANEAIFTFVAVDENGHPRSADKRLTKAVQCSRLPAARQLSDRLQQCKYRALLCVYSGRINCVRYRPLDPSLTFNLSWITCSSPLEAKKDLHLILSPT